MVLNVLLVSILFSISTALIALILFAFSKRKQTHGLSIMGLLFIVNFIYIFGYALELVSASELGKMFFNHMQYFGLPLILPFWFLLSLQFRNKNQNGTLKKALPLFIIPAITVILNLTYTQNGLHYVSSELVNWRGFDVLVFQKGVWYYIETAYKIIISAGTIIIFFNIYKKVSDMKKKQSFILFIMSIVAFLLSMSALFSNTTSTIDFVPILMSTAAILMFITLFKYELYDLVPLAHTRLFDVIDYPIMILTDAMVVVKANAAAREVFSIKGTDNIPINELLLDNINCIEKMKNGKECMIKRIVGTDHRHYSVRLTSLSSPNNKKDKHYGYLLMFADITSHIHQVMSLKNEAAVEPLTGLFNRRHFYTMAEFAMGAVNKEEKPLSVIMLDIDHFKNINDLYGHQGGDYILKAVVDVIKSQLRKNDIFARYGGDEFIVLLPATDSETAMAIAQRVCDAVRETMLDYDGNCIPLTISGGVSGIKSPTDCEISSLIFMADKALYKAKSTGRDRVC